VGQSHQFFDAAYFSNGSKCGYKSRKKRGKKSNGQLKEFKKIKMQIQYEFVGN